MGSIDNVGDLDPGPNVYPINTNGGWDVFFVSLDGAGNFMWAGMMGGLSNDFATGIARDVSGNIYAVGSFYGSGDYDPGPSVFTLNALRSQVTFGLENSLLPAAWYG